MIHAKDKVSIDCNNDVLRRVDTKLQQSTPISLNINYDISYDHNSVIVAPLSTIYSNRTRFL